MIRRPSRGSERAGSPTTLDAGRPRRAHAVRRLAQPRPRGSPRAARAPARRDARHRRLASPGYTRRCRPALGGRAVARARRQGPAPLPAAARAASTTCSTPPSSSSTTRTYAGRDAAGSRDPTTSAASARCGACCAAAAGAFFRKSPGRRGPHAARRDQPRGEQHEPRRDASPGRPASCCSTPFGRTEHARVDDHRGARTTSRASARPRSPSEAAEPPPSAKNSQPVQRGQRGHGPRPTALHGWPSPGSTCTVASYMSRQRPPSRRCSTPAAYAVDGPAAEHGYACSPRTATRRCWTRPGAARPHPWLPPTRQPDPAAATCATA